MSSRSSTTASRRRRHPAATGGDQRGHLSLRRSLLVGGLALGLSAYTFVAPASSQDDQPTTNLTITATASGENARIPEDFQGFSVESADFAHGHLTKERMSERLQTLGDHGTIRLGGYSMDLVWPAFGAWRDTPAPKEAIGGTVDQGDLDNLKELLDDSGWNVTLGVPLKSIIDPSKVKDPNKDPSPKVTLQQVVAEVKAAHETLGDDLLSVELGNEYDNVTTLTGSKMWDTMKQYQAVIQEAVPHARLKMAGPSANTAKTNTRLDEFVTAVQADTSTNPQRVLAERPRTGTRGVIAVRAR